VVDNLKQIKSFLQWDTNNDYYYVEITQRKKDNPDLERNSNIIHSYRVTSETHLDILMPELIMLSIHYNARVGINLNRKSFKKAAYRTVKKMADQMCDDEFKNVQTAYEMSSGGNVNNGQKYWILDMDNATECDLDLMMAIDCYEPNPYSNKALAVVHTKTGYHIITKPFRVDQFRKDYPNHSFEIKRNNLTILYIP